MKAIHLICKRGDGVNLNGVNSSDVKGTFLSGRWDLTEADSRLLVGGWMYLHSTKADRSEFGGEIEAYERVTVEDVGHTQRTVFRVKRQSAGTGQRWRGKQHGMAHSGELVSADLPHEKKNL